MTIAKLIMASVAALTLVGPGALAQENQTTGQIIRIDEANGKITLEHKQAGTVGAAAANLVDVYKLKNDLVLNDLKVGDAVVYNEAMVGGVWTVTKIQKQ